MWSRDATKRSTTTIYEDWPQKTLARMGDRSMAEPGIDILQEDCPTCHGLGEYPDPCESCLCESKDIGAMSTYDPQ